MKKVISALLILVLTFSVLIYAAPVEANAESLYVRKIVSVVFDDSSSMQTDNRIEYASYAMQTFCGMLNSEDQLYITYMNRGVNGTEQCVSEKVDLSSGGIQRSVDLIRSVPADGSSTRYGAVEKAFNTLESTKDPDPNTQYWLVVITDGGFNGQNVPANYSSDPKGALNREFKKYANKTMPNGSNPQITFLGIGNVVSPDENQAAGIYTYSAANASGIIGAMSEMASKISGRTRLQDNVIELSADKQTVKISSEIALLNIAVFVQGSDAEVLDVAYCYDTSTSIVKTREASIKAPHDASLAGRAYLWGDSQKFIRADSYEIKFSQPVDKNNVIVLFEPALEIKTVYKLNGTEVTYDELLDKAMEKDKITVSCKVCEMGTDNEVDLSKLGNSVTKYEITVFENGKAVKTEPLGNGKELKEYELKNVPTEIKATLVIGGINPIENSISFSPVEYKVTLKDSYEIKATFNNNVKSIKHDNVSTNKDLQIFFTVYSKSDGKAITDPAAVKALNPQITFSENGCSGKIEYLNDGRIAVTPNSVPSSPPNPDAYDVTVTCKIVNNADASDEISAQETYTVMVANYAITVGGAKDFVRKNEWFGNDVSVSFYITKDGVKLDKQALGAQENISIILNEVYTNEEADPKLTYKLEVASDGLITVTPYCATEHKITFFNWWVNWAYYFGLEDEDVTVSFSHSYGNAESTIKVEGADAKYQILNVYLPLIIEIIALALLLTWIILVVTKPRYLKSGTIYVGENKYNASEGTHTPRNFTAVKLDKFNKVKRGNGRLKFKKAADVVSANGIRLRADKGGRIICEMPFPWYKSNVEPADTDFTNLKTPADIADYITKKKKLEINEFATTVTVDGEFERAMPPANTRMAKYIVVPDSGNGVSKTEDGKKVIKSGKIFIYTNG